MHACGGCSITYERFRSGFTFADAATAVKYRGNLDASGNERCFYSRRSVIGQLRRWKRDAWGDHLNTCGRGVVDASDFRWQVARGRWYLELDEDSRCHLDAEAGSELQVELDGDAYLGILGSDHRLVVQAHWRDLVLPCSWVRIRNTRLLEASAGRGDVEELQPFTLF